MNELEQKAAALLVDAEAPACDHPIRKSNR
jgi:hypothetical protein